MATVSPSGQFASITSDLPAGFSWNTSQLYTTGDVTLTPEPSTLALLGVGAVGLVGYGSWWRRRRRSWSITAIPIRNAVRCAGRPHPTHREDLVVHFKNNFRVPTPSGRIPDVANR